VAASLRYEVAIINAETDEHAFSLARLCLWINGALAILTLICAAVLHVWAPGLVGSLAEALWLLPFALLAGGAFQTLTYILLRSQAFKESSAARGVQALGNSGTALALGYVPATGSGLMLADVTGRLAALFYAYARMIAKDARYRFWRARGHTLRHLAWKFREYPLVSLPGSLLDSVGTTITPMLMFGLFGPAVSGQYALVDRGIAVPIAVIVQAVSQVYMASFSAALRSDPPQATALYKRLVVAQLKIGIVPAIVIALLGPWIFESLFGSQWSEAGQFAQVMSPLLLTSFALAPVTMTLLMLERQRLNFAWYVCRLSVVLAAWFVMSRLHVPPLSAMAIHVAVNLVAYGVLVFITYRSLPAAGGGSEVSGP
jgi:O-antigen/teichoic acid export membrane protein